MKENKGITLIALVITIIILLILAGISIATLTGENGLLTKASKADKDADIADTKEQIKLEIMGSLDKETANYTNKNVIDAVDKITGVTVDENTPTVQTQKGNEVDISDLWEKVIYMLRIWDGGYAEIPFKSGQVWTEDFLESISKEIQLNRCGYTCLRGNPPAETLWFKPGPFDPYGHYVLNGSAVKFGEPLVTGAKYDYVLEE